MDVMKRLAIAEQERDDAIEAMNEAEELARTYRTGYRNMRAKYDDLIRRVDSSRIILDDVVSALGDNDGE